MLLMTQTSQWTNAFSLPTLYIVLPLMLASLLGAAVGLEREWRQRMAGLRTNALVSLGAAIFTLMSMMVTSDAGEASPTRMAAQVVSGIGFLGAGVIVKEGANIRGLNTAATLWCSAAIGVMTGAGYYGAAIAAALVIVMTNLCLRPVVRLINRYPLDTAADESWWQYRLDVTCLEADEAHIRALLLQGLAGSGLRLQRLESQHDDNHVNKVSVFAELLTNRRDDAAVEKVVGRLSLEPCVALAAWDVKSV